MADQPFVPTVSADKTIAEFTPKAMVLGIVLALLMAAANTYLGLYAGMTVSASIPAAVISMGILRGILRRGTILENNLVQTIASAGQSVAAGIIFTIPALVITGVWTEFKYWETTAVAVLGGILGVLFMIPLRRALIVEEKELKFPEGVACAEVLEVGERGGSGVWYVVSAIGLGMVFKFFIAGVKLFKGTVEGAFRLGKSALYFGGDISPALVAVGYIIGFNVSLLIFLGGLLGWLLLIPGFYLFNGYPAGTESVLDTMYGTWSAQIRYIGVGAMIVGGLSSIVSVRHGIVKGIQGAVAGYQSAKGHGPARLRTDKDIHLGVILPLLIAVAAAVFVLYIFLTGSLAIGSVAGVAMLVASFFFVAVSSYIVGLVGSSNNPVSGMTISTLLFASALLLAFGMRGDPGILAVLGVAGVVCCAACTAGDVSQDLKTGHLVGATPAAQQWGMIIGAVVASFIIAPILTVLHASYGIGVRVHEGVDFLKAPQAHLFASITKAMFGADDTMPWGMVGLGIGVGLALIACDEILKRRQSAFRTYVMPVAVGIYLPWSLSWPILLGGIAAAAIYKVVGKEREKEAEHRGVLFGSGLIAGESLMGIVIAVLIFLKIEPLTAPVSDAAAGALSVGALLALVGLIAVVVLKGRAGAANRGE